MQIGFIGVGAMGGPLARNLIKSGKNVLIYDISSDAIDRTISVGETGKKAESIEDLLAVDILFTSLPMPDDLRKLMLGDDGILTKLKGGSFYIDVSTIDARLATEINQACLEKNIRFLGCPLGRTPGHAERAEEPIYAGGKEKDFKEMQPLLESIGSPVIYMGSCEASYTAKLLGNMMGGVFIAAISEAFAVAEKVGLDMSHFLKFAKESGGDSAQLNVRGPKIVDKDFSSLFSLDLLLKDMRLGCEVAEAVGVDVQTMKQAREAFLRASQQGLGRQDAVAVFKAIGTMEYRN